MTATLQRSVPPSVSPIPPVAPGPRPLWSVMIPTYNCAGYLRETLASVLAQDPGPEAMQIEVVDDASTRDDPEAVVREFGGSRVGFFRQPENVGQPAVSCVPAGEPERRRLPVTSSVPSGPWSSSSWPSASVIP